MPGQAFDPLAQTRSAGEPDCDVFLWGTVFLDIIFSGLQRMPQAGTEEWADGMASCPGGIANLAVACRRLGLRTALAAAFSDDDYGDFCFRTMADQEGIDLSRSRRFEDWHTPVTVSMSVDKDRSMVTHGHDAPISATQMIGVPPRSRAVIVDLAEQSPLGGSETTWVGHAVSAGSLIFADVGWDPSQRWDASVLDQLRYCHAFTPNAVEAMAYTRTRTPQDAVYALADKVPMVVVTNGKEGAIGIDSTTGEEATIPALRVQAMDPTGAGDVFGAALVLGTLMAWPLADRLAFSSLCSALSLSQFGGSLAAPGWGDIADWWKALASSPSSDAYTTALRRRYAFLEPMLASVPAGACRRASATIARRADTPGLQ